MIERGNHTHGASFRNDLALRVYVASHCEACGESERIVRALQLRLPDLEIILVDVDCETPSDEIFAVPTFCYRGRIVSLGNPSEAELCARITAVDEDLGSVPRAALDVHGDGAERAPRNRYDLRSRRITGGSPKAWTACFGAMGIGGAVLCSLSMLAPALGLCASQLVSTSGHGEPAHTLSGPAWLVVVDQFGPEIVIASVLVLVLSILLNGRRGVLPALIGGAVLYLGMYGQADMALMYGAMIVGIMTLTLAYVSSLHTAGPTGTHAER